MQIAVIGVGLIGGSIGLAARERLGASVCGYDPAAGVTESALERGAIDSTAGALAEAVSGAEVIFVATPVGVLIQAVAEVLSSAGEEAVVTDVGSTKREVVAANPDTRFVGGHPLAGMESAGVEHARADLFDGAVWYLTPVGDTAGVAYERIHRVVTGLGARVSAIDPETHDRLLADVSHLPHIFANVLVSQASAALAADDERLPATGPSFRDATRVAGSNSGIWTDIYRSNRDALVERIDSSIARLGELRDALARDDAEWITAWNEAARSDRERLLETDLAGGPVTELRVLVPNRPGVVAEIALELGKAGLNIDDMALYPAPDMREGVVALWIAGAEESQRAAQLLTELGFSVTQI